MAVTGAVNATYEGAVMGAGGREFGIALYPNRSSIAAVQAAVAEGRPERAARIEALNLTLDEEPAFAVQAIGAWCGLPRVPLTFAVRKGRPAPVEAPEVLVLAVTLHAISRMSDRLDEVARHTLTFGNAEINVTVRRKRR